MRKDDNHIDNTDHLRPVVCSIYLVCLKQLANDADRLIRQLEAENKQYHQENTEMYAEMCMLREKVHRLEAERDAAIADMTEMARSVGESVCEWCDQTECECTCADIGIYAGFNWSGVQKEE